MEVVMQVEDVLPGGIREADHWHRTTNDYTCSRCRRPIDDDNDEVPLLLFSKDGNDMLIYCTDCLEAAGT